MVREEPEIEDRAGDDGMLGSARLDHELAGRRIDVHAVLEGFLLRVGGPRRGAAG